MLITVSDNVFKLDTNNTSYIFSISKNGHPQHIYYGKKLPASDAEALILKNTIGLGSTVYYDKK